MRKEKIYPKYNEVFTLEHLYYSGLKCCNGVMWKKSVQIFRLNIIKNCVDLLEELRRGEFRSRGFREFYIMERGKKRFIQAVEIRERTVQKTLTEYVLKPLLIPSLIADNSASIEGKGTDFAIKRFREHLRWHYARHGTKGGILICDFHDYFHSIDHEILLKMLRKKIKDDGLFKLTKYFVEQFKDGGLGLGSEISQICAIFYPNKMDHYIKEKFRIHGYGRFMDDFYVISEDINKLHQILEYIKEVSIELKLTLNTKHTKIVRFDSGEIFTYLKNRTHFSDTGKIVMRNVRKNYKARRSYTRYQRKMLDENHRVDFEYVYKSFLIWKKYALKRKNSYKSVRSVEKHFNAVFQVEIMYEKENNRNIKKIVNSNYRQERFIQEQNRKIDNIYRYSKKRDKLLDQMFDYIQILEGKILEIDKMIESCQLGKITSQQEVK